MFRDFETRSFGQLSLIIGRISSATATNVLIRNSVADRSIPDRMRRMINIIPYIIFGINRRVDQPERSFQYSFHLIPSLPSRLSRVEMQNFRKNVANFRREKSTR